MDTMVGPGTLALPGAGKSEGKNRQKSRVDLMNGLVEGKRLNRKRPVLYGEIGVPVYVLIIELPDIWHNGGLINHIQSVNIKCINTMMEISPAKKQGN